ncbi:MAG TPA: hypothetical protein VFZ31_02290 [Vicinamibacterales bacterium]
MTMNSLRFRPLARQALINAVGVDAPSDRTIIEGFNTLSDQLSAALQRLFGANPTRALAERSRQLAEQDYAFLNAILKHDDGRLHAGVNGESLPPDELLSALSAVLAHELDLLTALLGEDFVLPLVNRAWLVNGPPPHRPSH